MYNKKCKTTFLFILALVCLLTLIIPFINVGYMGTKNIALFIFYYIFIVIFGISLIANIVIGIYSLFTSNFTLICLQESASYVSFFMILLNLIIFAPSLNTSLTFGYSILTIETFVMAFLSDIIKLIKKLPKAFKEFKEKLKENKYKKQLLLLENSKNEINENVNKNVIVDKNENLNESVKATENIYYEPDKYGDVNQVEIIPSDDELI